jgi:hypothetical protein
LLQLFLIEYTTGRGLGVSYNTPGMLVWYQRYPSAQHTCTYD